MSNDYRDYLQHHGVKGMKWGVRRRPELSDSRRNLNSLKSQRRSAKKKYNKDFNKMYRYANNHRLGMNFSKKQTKEYNKRANKAYNSARAFERANKKYKAAKKQRRSDINSTAKSIRKNSSIGSKLLFSKGTQKRAAKYVVDNNMSVHDAKRRANRDAAVNTALVLGAYGAATLAKRKFR